MRVRLIAALLFACLPVAFCHGRLTKPLPRFGAGSNAGRDNGPTPGHTSENFVCRHNEKQAGNTNPDEKITAGQPLTIKWDFSAAHVGDCAVYLSYDTTLSRTEQKYFKIANLFKCREQNKQDVTITIPDFVPPGKAVLRWDWYALHQFPGVEFYSQCIDVDITSASTATISQFTTYSIISPPIYPRSGREGVGYRNAFGGGDQFMTGPACANDYKENSCELTAKGTKGFTGGGGEKIDGSKMGTTNAPGAIEPDPGMIPGVTPQCEIYVVQTGDSMSKIAKNYTDRGKVVTFTEICQANGKLKPVNTCDEIDVGDDYVIPFKGSACESAGVEGGSKAVAGTVTANAIMTTFSTSVLVSFVFTLF